MFAEYWQLALRSLLTYRLRSALTLVAISIGVTAIISLVSIAQSSLATTSRSVEEFGGSRFIVLWGDSPKKAALKQADYLDGLTLADKYALVQAIPWIQRATALTGTDTLGVRTIGGKDTDCDRIGIEPNFLAVFAMHLAAGRNLEAADLREERRVCLLGATLAKTLFGLQDPIGQDVIVSGQRYRVVGRTAFEPKRQMNFAFDWNNLVMVPVTTISPAGHIGIIGMTSRDLSENEDLINRANAILLARHNGLDDFQFLDLGDVLKDYRKVFMGILVVVGLVACVSLLIGGVGIMNMMLVAVQERRREIGIRKASGATAAEIMGQFLVESAMLGLLGALSGTALGLLVCGTASLIGTRVNPGWVGVVSYPAIALAVVAAIGTGLFFGWYPARRAARLDPIVCLRA